MCFRVSSSHDDRFFALLLSAIISMMERGKEKEKVTMSL